MGQQFSTECSLCAPANDDLVTEKGTELKGEHYCSKPASPGFCNDEDGFPSFPPQFAPKLSQEGPIISSRGSDTPGAAPLPPPCEDTQYAAPSLAAVKALEPPRVPSRPAAPVASKAGCGGGGSMSSSPAADAAGPSPPSGMDLEVILLDLEGAEASAYGSAFDQFGGGGALLADNAALRSFLSTNTAIADGEDLELKLVGAASQSDSFTIDKAAFMGLLRDMVVNEGEVLEQFFSQSSGGEPIDVMDARTGLLTFMQGKLKTTFTDAQYERIFDTVMAGLGAQADMEEWTEMCKKAGRIVCLTKFLRI